METKHCDLLVMGGGGAGLVAAARAAELNPNIHIIVVEKGNATGGGACQAGDFRVYGSQWQKERGLNDNLAADLRKRMDETFWRIDRKLALNAFLGTGRFFDWCCTLSPDCADRFVPGRYVFDRPDKGPEIPVYAGLPEERKNQPEMPMMPPPDGDDEKGGMPAGMPMPGMRTGTYLMKLMRETCKKDGVEILTKTRITDVTVENGTIIGATAEGPDGTVEITCRAVVLATGSWISNPKYLEMAFSAVCKNGSRKARALGPPEQQLYRRRHSHCGKGRGPSGLPELLHSRHGAGTGGKGRQSHLPPGTDGRCHGPEPLCHSD